MKKSLLFLIFIFFCAFSFNCANANQIEDATLFYNEAVDLYRQDDVKKSIELFRKAIDLYPKFYEAHYNLAQILMSLGRNDEAEKSLEVILKIRPNDPETLYNIAKIEYKKGYLSKSHSYLEKIAQTSPQYPSAKILMDKIEKRQNELNLEAKLNEHKAVPEGGKSIGEDLIVISAPSGIATDAQGNIYVASFSENTIYKITIYGQKTIFSKSSLIKGPVGITIDKNSNVYVANYTANNIVKITKDGQASIFSDIQKPYCLIYNTEYDRLYVTEQGTNKLIKFDL